MSLPADPKAYLLTQRLPAHRRTWSLFLPAVAGRAAQAAHAEATLVHVSSSARSEGTFLSDFIRLYMLLATCTGRGRDPAAAQAAGAAAAAAAQRDRRGVVYREPGAIGHAGGRQLA